MLREASEIASGDNDPCAARATSKSWRLKFRDSLLSGEDCLCSDTF